MNNKKEKIILGLYVIINILLILFYINELRYKTEDVNKDGLVNAQDYITIKNYIMKGSK